ncbi:MAG: SMC-Scp complex subunit ScpB [Gammaproteobacteria bacterium]
MNKMNTKSILEATLLAAGKPMTVDALLQVFGDEDKPDRNEVRSLLDELETDYDGRGIELIRVASGFRIQVSQAMEPWVSRLTSEKPTKYSRALLETLALVAYRQPITRGEIEDVRGVSVSTSIIKTLQEREWVRIVGHRDVPGKPAMYGTTRQFLDYFSLQSLDELPTLMELRSLDSIGAELDLVFPGEEVVSDEAESADIPHSASSEPSANAEEQVDDNQIEQPDILH